MSDLQLQQTVFENIKTLCSNYKKDSQSRKTPEYLTKRLISLESQWEDFEKRHHFLENLEYKNITYFIDSIYEKTKELYESTKTDILQLMLSTTSKASDAEVPTLLQPGQESSISGKTKELLQRQESNFKAIKRAMSKVKLGETNNKWDLEDHLSILKSKWEAIDKLHWELETLQLTTENNYNQVFLEVEHQYDMLRKNINAKIWSNTHFHQSTPKIEIPEFTGNYTQWTSFKDIFLEAVHNNPTISSGQKMQHLKSKLRGEPERLVQHLHISVENYESCWEILNQRYDNRRLLFSSYMNAMYNLPTIQQPNAFNLKKMHDIIIESLNGLTNMDIETSSWGPIVVHTMSQKLDATTYNEYIKELSDPREVPSLSEFTTFLENKFMAFKTMRNQNKEHLNQQNKTSQLPKKNIMPFKREYPKTYHTTNTSKCPLCNGNHVLMQCAKFIDMNIDQRNATVTKLRVCKNCLYSHGHERCKSMKTCKECNLPHHTLLHNNNMNNSAHYGKKNYEPKPSTSQQTNHLSNDETEILLTTAQLKVKAVDGTYVVLRALLDQGSQVNLLSENAAQLLNLPRKRMNASISGVGSVSGECTGYVNLQCKSIHSDYGFQTKTLIMKKLINNLPNRSFDAPNWAHIQNLKLADPEFNVSRRVDILLGADIYSEIIMEGVLKPDKHSPTAQQTRLGWILCGSIRTLNCCVTLTNISELTKFWETEEIIQTNDEITKDDYCERYYQETTVRNQDGRYVVKMPFHENFEEKLGKSKHTAMSQYLQLEKRLSKKLKTMYTDFIEEYIELGHMMPSHAREELQCFLPHHGVLRESSTTTKLRVVFNASQKTSSGYSLNDVMEKGPNLQKDLQFLILKWRTYEFVFTADIEKMYHCIILAPEQHRLQKILWRDITGNIKEMKLCTVTYGTKAAPWLAMRTLRQLAIDDGHKHPEAANILQNECYVDDVITGHHSLEQARVLQQSLIKLLRGAGMNLRKFTSNNQALLQNLSQDQIANTTLTFDFKDETSQKTLGLAWDPTSDTFRFDWKTNFTEKRLTKRQLLSEISTLFDPLGWLAPVTVAAKLLFQDIWMSKIGWNDYLPKEIDEKWLKLRQELHCIKNVKINRWIGYKQQNIELHGFSDASEKAYACVVYCRVNEGDHPIVTLFAAKTKVAPLSQKVTLPRLELCGALLLSQLMEKAINVLSDSSITIHAWCDSKVVLAWIQGNPQRWEKYISNRVIKITKRIPADRWNYVHTSVNPADCASRGLSPSKLLNHQQWWQGPPFLQTFNETNHRNCHFTTHLGEKTEVRSYVVQNEQQKNHFINLLLHKLSSMTQICKVVAWVSRAIAAMRGRQLDTYMHNGLTNAELQQSTLLIVKFAQSMEFTDEIKQLKSDNMVSSKSKIYKLNPYLDDDDVMRVGGRLNKSDLPPNMKNPIILPHAGRMTVLVIDQAHLKTLHGGARLTLAQIRQRYWIVGGNSAVKMRLRNCVQCHRHSAHNNHQQMSDLPKQRITPSRPFSHTGVDFTGSIDIKINKGRGVKTSKAYIVIFVCMATKAVHIELASDLSTETFIAAFKRMCGRRGTPEHVYSDNGTNFVGASKVLKENFIDFQQLLTPEFFDKISQLEVQWHFNAPSWPSAGGLWEAAVKAMKHHLKRTLGEQKLTYEELLTLLCEIEGCLNSRPLCPLTEDPEEFYNCLTPGHFLTGGPVMSLPQSDSNDIKNIDIRKFWRLTCHMLQCFWKAWSTDYLHQLQIRSKWQKPSPNIQVNDVVLIKEDNLPPGKWALGRVTELHPGGDGLVRVTTLKTKTGLIKRPVTKLSPLPLASSKEKKAFHIQLLSIHKAPTEPSTPAVKNQTSNLLCNNKNKSKLFNSMFAIMLTLFMIVSGSHVTATETSAQITSLQNRPIYYDLNGKIQLIHDEWILLMYYNLTNYWESTQSMQIYLNHLNMACDNMEPQYCRNTVDQLQHEMDLLSYYNTMLLEPHQHLSTRKKRGLIDGVGYVANSLFGILDERFAERYHHDIKAIQDNEKYVLALVQNQTSIVQLENNALKKNEVIIKQQFDKINLFLRQTNISFTKIETGMEALMAMNYFSSSSITATLLLANLRRMQEMFFNTLTDIYQGHIDMHLITPVNLIKQLTEISGHLPRTLFLPIDNIREQIRDVYHLLYVRGRVTNTYFLFEIHIPLICDEDFTFYQAIPLPVPLNNTTTSWVQVSSDFIAINLRKNTYITLSQDDIRRCTHRSLDNYICNAKLPIYNIRNSKAPCEAKLLDQQNTILCDTNKGQCRDSWIKLHNTNMWLIICCDECVIRMICDSDVTIHSVTVSSIITMTQGCMLQADELTIYAHNQFNSAVNMEPMHIPTINSSINKVVELAFRNIPNTQHQSDSSSLEEIDEKIVSQREQENRGLAISSYDIHQFTIIYILLGSAVVAVSVWVARKRCCCIKRTPSTPPRSLHKTEDIEMQEIQPVSTSNALSHQNVAFKFE